MLIPSSIVGMKFHPGASDKLRETPAGTVVTLEREPDNRFDPNAIRCVVGGLICGYIPKAQAVRLAEDMDAGKPVTATLVEATKLHIEVEDAPPLDDEVGEDLSI